jgi:predicted nicotinamide N-methyase
MTAPASLRAFVRRHTQLGPVTGLPGIRLHQADDVTEVWRAVGLELDQGDPPLPYWAFAWSGGLAVARYLIDHPDEVAGRAVLDVAAGSGLCAIVALRLGAVAAKAVDIDPLSEAAVALNARANGVRVGFSRRDILDGPPPDAEVILAGDVSYEETFAGRVSGFLERAAEAGSRVILGDPGRRYLPEGLERLGTYPVRPSREIERPDLETAAVYTMSGPRERASRAAIT